MMVPRRLHQKTVTPRANNDKLQVMLLRLFDIAVCSYSPISIIMLSAGFLIQKLLQPEYTNKQWQRKMDLNRGLGVSAQNLGGSRGMPP